MKTAPLPRNPEEAGRRAATKWETPDCPFPVGSKAAGEWADGLLSGREAFSWNVRNVVQLGSTARWMSEAISQELAFPMAKAIMPLGLESLIYFRVGFILNDQAHAVPDLKIEGWRRFAMVGNRSLQGRTLESMGVEDPSWFERVVRDEALAFVEKFLGGKFAPSEASVGAAFTADMRELMVWMGRTAETKDWYPKP